MNRRRRKQSCLVGVRARERFGLLTPDQVRQLELMYARCRTEDEFKQVTKVMQDYCGNQGDDCYSRLLRGEMEDLA